MSPFADAMMVSDEEGNNRGDVDSLDHESRRERLYGLPAVSGGGVSDGAGFLKERMRRCVGEGE